LQELTVKYEVDIQGDQSGNEIDEFRCVDRNSIGESVGRSTTAIKCKRYESKWASRS